MRNTVFFDQTGQFLTRSHQGNKYIMVMVEIDINAIIVEPIKICKNAELTKAYRTMIQRFWQAGIIPKKHILDNKVSETLKKIQYGTGNTRHPPQECSGGGHQEFQGTLPECPLRNITGFSAIIVGHTTTTGWNNNQPIAKFQFNYQRFVIHTSKRTIWL